MKLIVASNNAHKIAELNAILSRLGMEVVSQREAGIQVEPEETGTTFEENSYIKAKAVLDASGMAAVADDSGLMVEALDGAPGVYSLLTPDGRKLVARGECPGEILTEPHGENGFGYDPVFYLPERGHTFAELPADVKNQISHRARALTLLAELIRKEWNYADK